MSEERRHAALPIEDVEGYWERIPHHVLYPFAGFFLGLGSPLGAFLLRYSVAAPLFKTLWLRSEFSYNRLFYLYMGIGTVTSFVTAQLAERSR